MDATFNNIDLGGYMVRRCSSSWDYCNGKCDKCNRSRYTASNKTDMRSPINFSNTTNGLPRYIAGNSRYDSGR